jgi:hypothetical protein
VAALVAGVAWLWAAPDVWRPDSSRIWRSCLIDAPRGMIRYTRKMLEHDRGCRHRAAGAGAYIRDERAAAEELICTHPTCNRPP